MYVRWVQPYPWPWGSDSTVAIVTRGFPDTVVTHGFLDTVMTPEVRQDQRGFSTMAPQVMLVDRAPLRDDAALARRALLDHRSPAQSNGRLADVLSIILF